MENVIPTVYSRSVCVCVRMDSRVLYEWRRRSLSLSQSLSPEGAAAQHCAKPKHCDPSAENPSQCSETFRQVSCLGHFYE